MTEKKHVVIFIDNDHLFLDFVLRFAKRESLNESYEFRKIIPPSELEDPNPITKCIKELHNVCEEGKKLAAIFVDIAIYEPAPPGKLDIDRTGIAIMTAIREEFPLLPILAITKYEKEHRLITETSLEDIEGIVSKSFMRSDPSFSKKDFLNIIEKAISKSKKRVSEKTLEQSPVIDNMELGKIKIEFQVNDPRCALQIQQIGNDIFYALLKKSFPFGEGTISYVRPGFSGSYLFRITVKVSRKEESPAKPKSWFVKIADGTKLQKELDKYKKLVERGIPRKFIPRARREEIIKVGKWAALVFEMEENVVTLSEFFESQASPNGLKRVVDSLTIFLKAYYGTPLQKQCFIWPTFYLYEFEERIRVEILRFIAEEGNLLHHKIGQETKGMIDRIREFVVSKGQTEESVWKCQLEVDTRYIHRDLNARNILVNPGNNKLSLIDFGRSRQDHCVKDITKLEVDMVFLAMDSKFMNNTDWDRVRIWKNLLPLNKKGGVLNANKTDVVSDTEIHKIIGFINSLRDALKQMSCVFTEEEYLISLLYHALCLLSYHDVTIQKKGFAVHYINEILETLSS